MLLKDKELDEKIESTIEPETTESVVENEKTIVDEKPIKKTAKSKAKKSDNKNDKDEELALKIAQWKSLYGKIYKNNIDKDEFVIWRLIKRKEYKELLNGGNIELMEKQEKVVKTVLLYPEEVEALIESRAGIATILTEEILAHSGFEISETTEL